MAKKSVAKKTIKKVTKIKASIKKPPKKTKIKAVKKTTDYPWLKSYPKTINWDMKFKEAPIHTILDETAAIFGDRPAIDFLGKKYTYKEVIEIVNRLTEGLQNLGVKKNTKVGLFLPNAPYYIFFYYAVLKAGGIVVNFSPLYADREIVNQIEDSETEIMVTLDLEMLYSKLYPMLAKTCLKKLIVCPLKDCLPFPKNILFPILKFKDVAKIKWDKHHVCFRDLVKNNGQPKPIMIDPSEDIALLQYTGGTTGIPKGAMLTHKNVYVNAQQAWSWFEAVQPGQERILAALPLFHVFAMTAVMNFGIITGSEIVMMFPRFHVDDAMKLIDKHKITFFPAVPTIYTMINHHPNVKKFNLSSLKACLSGGAGLPVEVKRQFEHLTGCKLIEAYGLSETSPAVTSNPMTGFNKAGSIGIPFPGTIVKIFDLKNKKKEVPLGTKGEICVMGPQVMKGYWHRKTETNDVLIGNIFHTGDVGYMDKDGYVFLVDRIKDLIITSGYNVYPRHVEEAIYLHKAVEEVTVIGVKDVKRGEIAKAFIKLKSGMTLTQSDLISFLKDKLSPIEMPKEIEFRATLPKTIIGKLSKKELVEEELQKAQKKNKR